jgi:hypothetical protein
LDDKRAEVIGAGCDDFVRKPFHLTEIFDKLVEHLGVRYVFQEPATSDAREDIDIGAIELTSTDLADLPEEWLIEFRRTLRTGRIHHILNHIDRIQPDHAGLARALTALVRGYKSEKLIALMDEMQTDVASEENNNE